MKKLKKLGLIVMSGGLVVGILANMQSYATVPGTNTLVNYNAANTGVSNNTQIQYAQISDDGKKVVWQSNGHDVIPGDPYSSSPATVLYEKDIQTGAVSYVTTDLSGAPVDVNSDLATGFAVSRTGRYVAFTAGSTNIVTTPTVPNAYNHHVYLKDMRLGTTTLVDQSSSGSLANIGGGPGTAQPYASGVSEDGRFVLFGSVATNLLGSGNPSSPNYTMNSYVKDMITGQVTNPAISGAGVRANANISRALTSCDGSFVTYNSNSTNLTPQDDGQYNVYLVDVRNGYRISNLTYAANSDVSVMSISCNGRYLVLASTSTNLTPDTVTGAKYHYFRYDRLTGEYALVDKSTSGYIPSTLSPRSNIYIGRIASDNGLVVFSDDDHALVSPAALRNREIYLRNPEAGTTEMVTINSSGVEQNATAPHSDSFGISARGDAVVYNSIATNLIPGVTTVGVSEGNIVISKVE